MINELIELSMRNRFMVIALAVIVMIVGLNSCREASMDVLPEFAPPQVIVQTEAPGMVAQEVEALISLPLEAALNGTPDVTLVKSVSLVGISNITVIFRYGTDVYRCRQLVNERIQMVLPRLPKNAGSPTMLPVMSVIGDILKVGLVSERTTPMELRTLADWTIRNRVLGVPGVSRVLVWGGEQKQFQVLVNPTKLKSFGVTLDEVTAAVQQANVAGPGGFLVTSDQQYTIRGATRVSDLSDLANSVVMVRNGVPILLRHISRVSLGPAFKIGDAVIDGRPGVVLIITKQPGVNTLEVTGRVEAALEELKRALPDDVRMVPIFRQATFIEHSIENVVSSIATGGFLVVVILILFLMNWRTSAISLTAIPLSLMAAILVIRGMGGTINTMTLGGLAIAVGEVVDDAIVDVENVYRRLRENRSAAQPQPVFRVILDACREVRSSVIYATFIVALVFLPVFSLGGVEGRIFAPLGMAYILATLASLLVALTVTPALCVYFLGSKGAIPRKEPVAVHLIRNVYGVMLKAVLRLPVLMVAFTLLLMVGAFCLIPTMGQAFLPEFREENIVITSTGLPGQSLEATTRMGIAVERKLKEHPEVITIGQRAGRAELDDDVGGSNFSEFDAMLKETNRPLQEILADIREHLSELPGVAFDMGSFISHRMDDVLSGGTRADIAIKIFGPDLEMLRNLASKAVAIMKTIEGAVDVRSEALVVVPEITIKIDRQHAARYGLTAADLSDTIQTLFNGRIVSEVLDNQRLFSLRIMLDEEARHNFDLIRSTLIDTPSGVRIPLSQVAAIYMGEGPNAIIRENVTRRMVVQANAQGRDVVGIVEEAKRKLSSELVLPPGYYIVYAGQYAAQREAMKALLLSAAVSFLGIILLLRQGMPSWKSTLLVLSNLPLATIGGIVAVCLTGNVLTIGSIIGFISVFGISTRNSLLLVTRMDALADQGETEEEAIFHGALDRVVPVLMTALTAALGMLPLAVMGGAGRELEQPLAVVIVGGMVSSTVLTLLVIPALMKVMVAPRRKIMVESVESIK